MPTFYVTIFYRCTRLWRITYGTKWSIFIPPTSRNICKSFRLRMANTSTARRQNRIKFSCIWCRRTSHMFVSFQYHKKNLLKFIYFSRYTTFFYSWLKFELGGIHKLGWQARERGVTKCQQYYIILSSKLVNVVFECPEWTEKYSSILLLT